MANHFVQFLREDMLRMRDGMIDGILEEQVTDEEKAEFLMLCNFSWI